MSRDTCFNCGDAWCSGLCTSMPRPFLTPLDARTDAINPSHYTAHPSGIDCITITEHMNFCLGNAIKYIWRAGLKGEALEDLQKAQWYIDREIKRRMAEGK